nr:hypothetical protein CFP56_45950 [Quercus suber]
MILGCFYLGGGVFVLVRKSVFGVLRMCYILTASCGVWGFGGSVLQSYSLTASCGVWGFGGCVTGLQLLV